MEPKLDYLIRFSHDLESFRVAEIEALALIEGVDMEILRYNAGSPFCVVRLPSPEAAAALVRRATLVHSVHEIWGSSHPVSGADPDPPAAPLSSPPASSSSVLSALHASIRSTSSAHWLRYTPETISFRLDIDSFNGKRGDRAARRQLIDSFSFLGFLGPIRMRDTDEVFTVFEEWRLRDPVTKVGLALVPDALLPSEGRAINDATNDTTASTPFAGTHLPPDAEPLRMFFGRLVSAATSHHLPHLHSLKTRRYISTTSMDAGLALLTANLALAGPGKLFYDPFTGTGGFPLACAAFGATAWGSDIDGRSLKGNEKGDGVGKGLKERSIKANFEQYGLGRLLGDLWAADFTNSPLRTWEFEVKGVEAADGDPSGAKTLARRRRAILDGIVCDPPYGVREGLRVLGRKNVDLTKPKIDRWRAPDYVAPKKPYSFTALLDDILDFAAESLVDGGRLSFWMPTANDEEQEMAIPEHPALKRVVVCAQVFNKWSRRLITYERIPDELVDQTIVRERKVEDMSGKSADDLNPFRKSYFNKFEAGNASCT